MQGLKINARACACVASLVTVTSWLAPEATAAKMTGDPATTCGDLIRPADDAVRIDCAAIVAPVTTRSRRKGADAVSTRHPGQYGILQGAWPDRPRPTPRRRRSNSRSILPVEWNGRSLQYGGGGFNGVLISGLALPPAYPFDTPSPLARGFATYGTDFGHETKPGEPPQALCAQRRGFENFSYRSYKKVRDAAVRLMVRAYGNPPTKLYFMGSSEGGREALTMAQRYPDDFDGIFARVPVINWVGLQHAGTRAGLATMGEGWIRPAQVNSLREAVLQACDTADGSDDQLVQDPVGCKAKFQPESAALRGGPKRRPVSDRRADHGDQDAAFDLQVSVHDGQRP